MILKTCLTTKNNFRFAILFSFLFIIVYYRLSIISNKLNYQKKKNNNNIIDIDPKKIVIISHHCPFCGLFSLYNKYLKCAITLITNGFIPLIDLTSTSNIFNNLDSPFLNKNAWELYFNQPFNLTLDKVDQNSIKRVKCEHFYSVNFDEIYGNDILRDYWSLMSKKYFPINKSIIKEAEAIKYELFKSSDNILGILMRGTDFLSKKPKYHNIPPTNEIVFQDIKKMNEKNKYDYFFITTEDYYIMKAFIRKYGNKLKHITFKNINYNYTSKNPIALSNDIKGNIDYMKNYLINIIILSKCLDIICARTNGAIGAFILSSGFRYKKVYNLGKY